MKRALSLLLAASLMAALALPAAAEEDGAQARLTRTTQAVKTVLDLDTDQYEEFHGEVYEELVPIWTLQWSRQKDGENLTVEALEDGTVIQYQLNRAAVPVGRSGNFPVFPAESEMDSVKKTAETFLAKVLSPGESAELEEPYGADQLNGTGFRFSGKLLLNGLPSPLNYSIRVEDGRVTSFWRDAQQTSFLGGVPGGEAAVSQAQAAAALKKQLGLKLEYVLDEDGAPVLRYVPEADVHTFYVDAAAGSLIDLTELQKKMNGSGRYALTAGGEASADMAAPAAMENGAAQKSLSAVEQAGVEKLKGVRTAAQLDTALRSVSGFGLGGYALTSSSYSLEKEDGEETVLCTLRYRRAAEEDAYTRTVTVNARTGEVRRVYSYAPWGREAKLTADQAQDRALAFLKGFAPGRAEALDLYDSEDQTADGAPSYSFTFARKVNGCFFPANSYSVDIDAAYGSVYRLYHAWDEDLTFPAPEGLISEAAALDAWMNTYDVVLAYRLVPRELDAKDPPKLIQQGMTYFNGLPLTYALEREKPCLGVDAKSGKPVFSDSASRDSGITYSDLSSSAAQEDIEKLARYGVGYDGGVFRPGKSLTQWDLICLLSSLRFWRMNPETAGEEERDMIYSDAYSRGLLTPAERADNAPMTRAGLVKMLLDDAGYGPAARLGGIYTTKYADQAGIPAAELGYAAIAQALGMAKGNYGGARAVTRGEAASMLCRLLER